MALPDRRVSGIVNVSQEIRDDPEWAVQVLQEVGTLVQYGDCGRCAGREVCQFIDYADPPECLTVYRVVSGPAPSTGDTEC